MKNIKRRKQRVTHIERVLKELEWLKKDIDYSDGDAAHHELMHHRFADMIEMMDFMLTQNQRRLSQEVAALTQSTPAEQITAPDRLPHPRSEKRDDTAAGGG